MSRDHDEAVLQLDEVLSQLSDKDIFNALLAFGEVIQPALTADLKDIARNILIESVGDLPIQAETILDLSNALVVDADRLICQTAWETHKTVLDDHADAVLFGCLAGTAAIVRGLDIKLNFTQ
jgi:hypothetical protein